MALTTLLAHYCYEVYIYTRIRDVQHLKERLVEEWSHFDQNIIDGAINQWRERLRACVRAEGGHFEDQL